MPKKLILFRDDDEVELPWKWEICDHCEGHGTSSSYLGAFTRDDIDEAGEEFMEDYIAGRFDRSCEYCEGGKVKTIDDSKMSKADLEAWGQQCAEDEACESIHRQERLMEGGWRVEGWAS